ncbi:MAG: alpha/beta hydrolase [Cryomorphaceae bacterium]|nr:MAG: alpha/beta hydrolase [Cryomorphaceae bacterium]
MELFFQFREKNLHYKKEGTGEALVLIHGFLENLSMWDEMAVEFSKTHQVIRIDLPGFGKSDCIEDIHSMELFAECIKQLLKELNVDKFTFIGHSMGGYAGLELLKICPEKINHFILFHSTAKADNKQKKNDRSRAIKTVKEKQNIYLKTAIPFLFTDQFQVPCSGNIQKMIAEANNLHSSGIIAALKGMQQRKDCNELLKILTCKKTYIAGTYDPLLNVAALREEASNNEANFIEIENAGHMSHFECPSETINTFLKLLF